MVDEHFAFTSNHKNFYKYETCSKAPHFSQADTHLALDLTVFVPFLAWGDFRPILCLGEGLASCIPAPPLSWEKPQYLRICRTFWFIFRFIKGDQLSPRSIPDFLIELWLGWVAREYDLCELLWVVIWEHPGENLRAWFTLLSTWEGVTILCCDDRIYQAVAS